VLKKFKYIFICLILPILLSGCSTWLGRQYVNTVTRYNRIYLAKEKITATDEGIKINYIDNFNMILPVINLGDENSLKGNGGVMDEVLKKSSHVIEKHPKSKWSDDAWFLMGQSYFYRGDFFAAIENFEYISTRYKGTKIAYKANLWTLYCYVLMDKQSESLAIINKLINDKTYPKEFKKGIYLSAAEIAVRQNKPTIALENLNKAMPLISKKIEKIRYHFILGQLYQSLDSFDQSTLHYRRVIKLNPPYDFNFNAQINMASTLAAGKNKNYKSAKRVLKRMLRDDKNIDYYSRIYFELGKVESSANQNIAAIRDFSISTREKGADDIIKTNAYMAIGDIYYKSKDFINAKNYYDSSNLSLTEQHPSFEKLSKRRSAQEAQLKHLVTLQTNDSLLFLAANPNILEKIIDRKIDEEEREKRILAIQKSKQDNSSSSGNSTVFNPNPFGGNLNVPVAAAAGGFPFYDIAQKGKGMNDFRIVWGDRKNTDNWRVKSLGRMATDNLDDDPKVITDTSDVKKENKDDKAPKIEEGPRKKYYTQIPYTDADKQKLNDENELALFELGKIYLLELNNATEGKSYLLKLLSKYPKSAYKAPAYYELAKSAKADQNMDEYQKYFNKLKDEFPNSAYLKVLKNELIKDNDANRNNTSSKVQEMYAEAYSLYKNGNYAETLAQKSAHDLKYAGNPLQANFDYLEALCYAKTKDLVRYETRLKSIIADYPNTSIAELASQNLFYIGQKIIIEDTNSKSNTAMFLSNKNLPHFILISIPASESSEQLKGGIADYNNQNYSLKSFELAEFTFINEKLILVKGIGDLKENINYRNVLLSKGALKNLNSNAQIMLIHQQNLQILLQEKDLYSYNLFAKKQYP